VFEQQSNLADVVSTMKRICMQNGTKPSEIYCPRREANAKPRMCIAGRAGAKVKVRLEFPEGRRHLPIVKVERS
jgi:hypothetical protein